MLNVAGCSSLHLYIDLHPHIFSTSVKQLDISHLENAFSTAVNDDNLIDFIFQNLLDRLPHLTLFKMESTLNTKIKEYDFIKRAFLYQGHPSLELLVSPHGMYHYYTRAFQLKLRFPARIVAEKYSQGDLFWENKEECEASNFLKQSTFKIVRSFKIIGGRSIHIIKKGTLQGLHLDIHSDQRDTKITYLNTSAKVTEFGKILRISNHKLHTSWLSVDSTVYVATYASKCTVSMFGSSSTSGPEELTNFDIQPGTHLAATLALLVGLHLESTTNRKEITEDNDN